MVGLSWWLKVLVTLTFGCLGAMVLHSSLRIALNAFKASANGTSIVPLKIKEKLDLILPHYDCVRTRHGTSKLRNFTICLHPTQEDQFVSGSIRASGSWELGHSESLYKCLKHAGKHPTFIDLGTNIGTHSLAMAAMNIPVVSVEPSPTNYNRFIESIRINKFQSLIKLFKFAVSDSRRNVSMSFSRGNLGNTYVIPTKTGSAVIEEQIIVPTILMDDLLEYSSKNAVIKIDIQAHECVAFRQARKLFEKLEIQCILMEWMHQDVDEACTNSMRSFLNSFNYKAFGVNGEVLNQTEYAKWPKDIMWRKN